MAICEFCGFDGYTPGEACGLCGTGEETAVRDGSAAPTVLATPLPRSRRTEGSALFKERYQVDQPLGRGGMGTVYRAVDTRSGRVVALKALHAATNLEDSSFRRFQREVRILRRIDHPLIPRIHDAGLHGETMYLVTDLIDGKSLRDLIATRGRFEPAEIVRIGAFIAEGIEVAHHNGVIHRDIKPHNVMITSSGEVRLLDFGVARDVTQGARSITETGILIGTPEYMAPEQFQGEKVDGRSDIYSLGVLLYQLATGALPFVGDTAIALGMKHVSEPPVPPRAMAPDLPAWLNRIILKCLEKRREDRYQTAGDLAADLRASSDRRRRVRRMRNGDFIVEDDPEDRSALVIASKEEKDWPPGTTLLLHGTYYRLDVRDYDIAMPGPWVYRFSFWREGEAIRRLVEYDPDQPAAPKKTIPLGKWFRR